MALDVELTCMCTKCQKIIPLGRPCRRHGSKYLRLLGEESSESSSYSSSESDDARRRSKRGKKSKHLISRDEKPRKDKRDRRQSRSSSPARSPERTRDRVPDRARPSRKYLSKERSPDRSDSEVSDIRSERQPKEKSKTSKDKTSFEGKSRHRRQESDSDPPLEVAHELPAESGPSSVEDTHVSESTAKGKEREVTIDRKPPTTKDSPTPEVESEAAPKASRSGPTSYVDALKARPVVTEDKAEYPSLKDGVAAGPLKPIAFERCSKQNKRGWPKDFDKFDPKKEGYPSQKWFPGTSCKKCGGLHPTEAHLKYWEAFTRKQDRDPSDPDKKTMCQVCLKHGYTCAWNHFTHDHGLMAPYDLPTNPGIEELGDSRLMVFRRPWPNDKYVPYHPYAYRPRELKNQKPEDYPNLHVPLRPVPYGLMINDGNFAGQLAALVNDQPYRTKAQVASLKPVRVTGKKDTKPSGPIKPQGSIKGEEKPAKTKLETGFDSKGRHPKLPNPFWKSDATQFPSEPYYKVFFPILGDQERAYCEHIRKMSEQYRVVLQKFPDMKEQKRLSEARKSANSSAWDILSRYQQYWRPGWKPDKDFALESNIFFQSLHKERLIDVLDTVSSISKKDLEKALDEAREQASKQVEIKVEPPKASPATKTAKQAKSGAAAAGSSLEFKRQSDVSDIIDFQPHKTPGDGMKTGKWADEEGSLIAELNDEEYSHPQVHPHKPHHAEAHVSQWVEYHQECLSDENWSEFTTQTASFFRYHLSNRFKMKGASKEILEGLKELHGTYDTAVEYLTLDLLALAPDKESTVPMTVAKVQVLRTSITELFEEYDRSVLHAIAKLKQVEGLVEFVREHDELQGYWSEMMGTLLPGRSSRYAFLPRFAWSNSTVALLDDKMSQEPPSRTGR